MLAGTVGIVGCGDDETTGSTGGTGGGGGAGGASAPACNNSALPTTGETASAQLACVEGIPFDFTLSFNATPTASVTAGENEFELQTSISVDVETVNEVLGLAPGVVLTVNSNSARVTPTQGDSSETSVTIVDEGLPCSLPFIEDTPAVFTMAVNMGTFTLDDGNTLELTVDSITQDLIAIGIPVTLTTEGGEDASCEFLPVESPVLPVVSFEAGMGGSGG
jgi:hypothetical protein